jgi:hypothetical protein
MKTENPRGNGTILLLLDASKVYLVKTIRFISKDCNVMYHDFLAEIHRNHRANPSQYSSSRHNGNKKYNFSIIIFSEYSAAKKTLNCF